MQASMQNNVQVNYEKWQLLIIIKLYYSISNTFELSNKTNTSFFNYFEF